MKTTTVDHKNREHALLSASSAYRWLACPPSAVASELYKDESSEFAEEGTRAHEVAELVASGKDPGDAPAEMIRNAGAYREYIQELKTENKALVLLEQRVDFSPWVPDGFGTCDCIIIQNNTLTIVDYKYGMGVPVYAEDNPQMMLYALGALNDFGFAAEVGNVDMHIYQPRINNISAAHMTVEELLCWGESIKQRAQLASKGKGTYKAGPHCKFCPHAARCRTLAGSCNEVIKTHDIAAKVPVLNPYEIADVLEMESQISLWLRRVKAYALEQLLDGNEIPGYKAVEGRASRGWDSEQTVKEVLEKAGYGPEEYTKTEMLSPAGLEGSIGKKKVAELLGDNIVKQPGAPTVAPATDKRPPLNRLADAQEDFK